MSAWGQKPTSGEHNRKFALLPKADIRVTHRHVCFLWRGNTDETAFFVKADARPARKNPTRKDVLSRQHGSGEAAVLVEVQCPMQIPAAGAGNAVDVAISCQVQRAGAPVRVKPHQRSAEARQAIDLLISTQFHVVKAPVLLPPVVTKERVGAKRSRAKLLLARQRRADETAVSTEPGLAPAARDAGNLDILLEDDEPWSAIGPSFRHLVSIGRKCRQHALWCGGANACRRIGNNSRRLARSTDLVGRAGPEIRGRVARELMPDHVDRHYRII